MYLQEREEKKAEDMQTIAPAEYKEGLVKYELGLRRSQANQCTEEGSDFLGFDQGRAKK